MNTSPIEEFPRLFLTKQYQFKNRLTTKQPLQKCIHGSPGNWSRISRAQFGNYCSKVVQYMKTKINQQNAQINSGVLPFGVTIPATVPQGSEIPEGRMNNPV